MPDRRYSEDEVAAIFRAATELPEPADTPATGVPAAGLTLAEVQAIGLEAGIGAEAIARAAQLVTSPPVVSQRVLGLPFRVSHTVPLHRRLTDAEWERLVVQLREVFDARGRCTWRARSAAGPTATSTSSSSRRRTGTRSASAPSTAARRPAPRSA
ncbi:MAG: hypothetical protein IPK12_24285 [Gemmatimonadetes bacterium]|nr:hypothetical protein [Gemmatimonadota bacterium]